MKPMIALIATGVILLLIMLYFGKTSFEGTFETNVYQNSPIYAKTAPYIKELESSINSVKLIYDNKTNSTSLLYSFDNNTNHTYESAVLKNVELTFPAKNNTLPLTLSNDVYTYNGKLNNELITVVFYYLINDKYTVKVIKSTYAE